MSSPTMAPATGAAPTNVQAEGTLAARLPWAVLAAYAVGKSLETRVRASQK